MDTRPELSEKDRANFREEFRDMFEYSGGAGTVSIRVELLEDLEATIPQGIKLSRILDPFDEPGWMRFQWGAQ